MRSQIIGLVLILTAGSGESLAESHQRADLPRVTQQMYKFLMEWALGAGSRREGQTGALTQNQYLQMPNNKALAVCIDWDASTPELPKAIAYGMWRGARTQTSARDQAMAKCREFQQGRAKCDCTLVDDNWSSVLVLPGSFVKRHFR